MDPFTLKQDVFSRNSGLLETDWMDNKCVVISGVGSVGSLEALQLARSGVGRFVLVDTDCMEIHNVCRHQCSIRDVGRYKVDAIADRILQINPDAQIRTWRRRIQDVPLKEFSDWTIPGQALFIGGCDNRVGNAYACDAAKELGVPFAASGFRDRAWAGELFVYLPQRGDICYRCAFTTQINESIAEERRNHFYLDDGRRNEVRIVPGLDVDIEYGVSLLDKVALDILNLGNPNYTFRLLPQIGQFNYFSGTIDRSEGEFWARILPQPLSLRSISLRPELRRCPCCTGRKPSEQ
jgi:molybdopterin/thiamine biosynthesis adenylyltransferase